MQNPYKTPSNRWVVCKCVPVRVLHFVANRYEARRLGEFAGSEKHVLHPVFFSRLQYSKYLAAVRVTKGDQIMWQRWTCRDIFLTARPPENGTSCRDIFF
jgi:hypothetical protein